MQIMVHQIVTLVPQPALAKKVCLPGPIAIHLHRRLHLLSMSSHPDLFLLFPYIRWGISGLDARCSIHRCSRCELSGLLPLDLLANVRDIEIQDAL